MADAPSTDANAAPAAAAPSAPAAPEYSSLTPELGPNGLPINPPAGEEGAAVDNDLIMNTFFGDGQYDPPANKSGSGQAKGSNEPDGVSQGSLASPEAAPAANGEDGSPQPGPSSTPQPTPEQAPAGAPPSPTPAPGAQPAAEGGAPAEISLEDRLVLANARALQEQNAALLARVQALESGAQPGQQSQPPAVPDQSGGQGQEQPLRLTVPDQLAAAIFSEDDATSRQGLNLLVSAVAQNAVNEAVRQSKLIVQQSLSGLVTAQEQTRQVQSMEETFYGRHQDLKNPLFRQLIQQTVDEKYKALPNAPWDDLLMDTVAATVRVKLKALGIDSKQEAEPPAQPGNGNGAAPQPQPRPQPAPMLDASTRGGSGGVPQDSGDFIKNTFV